MAKRSFWENLGRGVARGLDKARDVSSRLHDKAEARLDLIAARDGIEKALRALGELAAKRARAGESRLALDEGPARERIDELLRLEERVRELEAAARAAEAPEPASPPQSEEAPASGDAPASNDAPASGGAEVDARSAAGGGSAVPEAEDDRASR